MMDKYLQDASPAPLIAYAILPLIRLLTGGNFFLWGHRGAAPEYGERSQDSSGASACYH